MIDIIIKICQHHGNLTIDKVVKQRLKKDNTIKYRCKFCLSQSHKNHYLKNKEKVKASHEKYRNENYEKYRKSSNDSAKKMRILNPEKEKERRKKGYSKYRKSTQIRQRRFKNKAVSELRDVYIRQRLTERSILKHEDIPQSLVEIKRAALKVKRIIKEKLCHKK